MKFFSLMALEQAAVDAAVATDAAAAGEMPAGAGLLGTLISLLPMILIFVIFYFMLIRPQRKKEKKAIAYPPSAASMAPSPPSRMTPWSCPWAATT